MKKVVIVGGGQAAGQVIASLRQQKFTGHIALLGEEPWYPYQRPPLSKKFLAGEMPAERLYIKPERFYDVPQLDVHLDTRVTEIDRTTKTVQTASGTTFDFDFLVIATGSRPKELPLPGVTLSGVHYLRGIDDVNAIRSEIEQEPRIVVIGAGYIGLEVAAVAARLGRVVTVIEMADRVMSRVVSPEVSQFFQNVHLDNGVSIKLSTGITHLVGQHHVEGVALDTGEVVPAEMVIVGIGIVPNIELALAAGLEVSDGIVVNDRCRTSDDHIYAVGDCTRHPNAILGYDVRLESVHNAIEQGKTAALNICGEDVRYAQVPWFWSDQYDLKLQIAGLSQGYEQVVIRGDVRQHSFACLYLSDDRLLAVDAVNRPKDFIQSKPLIANRTRLDLSKLADVSIDLREFS